MNQTKMRARDWAFLAIIFFTLLISIIAGGDVAL